MAQNVRACVLAAGKGTRMGGDCPKVLVEAANRPLVYWVLDALSEAGVNDTVAVVGYKKDDVVAKLPTGVRWVEQSPQLGTGHAVMCARSLLSEAPDDAVLVTCGDMPLLTAESFRAIIALRKEQDAACALLTVKIPAESRFGRVIRGNDGNVLRIVEAKDATADELAVLEGNTGVMCFSQQALWSALDRVGNKNAQGEYYLTDVIGILIEDGLQVAAYQCEDEQEALGVNTPADLEQVENGLAARKA